GDVDARIGQRQSRARRADETRVAGAGVGSLRVLDRYRGEIDSGDLGRGLREERGAVAFPARHIEHALAGHRPRGEVVAMPVLDPDLAAHARHEALAGEFELAHSSDTPRRASARASQGRGSARRARSRWRRAKVAAILATSGSGSETRSPCWRL